MPRTLVLPGVSPDGAVAAASRAEQQFASSADRLVLRMESRSTRGDLDSEPVLLVRSLQHLECSITRYLRLSPKPPMDACVAGCTVGVRFASGPRRGDFFPAPTLGRRMGVSTSRSAPYYQP